MFPKLCMKTINVIKKKGDYLKNGFLATGQYFNLTLKVRKRTPYVEVMFLKFNIPDIPKSRKIPTLATFIIIYILRNTTNISIYSLKRLAILSKFYIAERTGFC